MTEKQCDRMINNKRCDHILFTCDWCYTDLCPSFECIRYYEQYERDEEYNRFHDMKDHDRCMESECKNITCNVSGYCRDCEQHHYYDMITDDVAIGSNRASYEPFDIIVNLDYDGFGHRGLKRGEFISTRYCESGRSGKVIIYCGIEDCQHGGFTREVIDNIIRTVQHIEHVKREEGQPYKILFHCYAGVSRSATLAIAYLASREKTTTREIYERVKQRRPRINPNEHFRELIGL